MNTQNRFDTEVRSFNNPERKRRRSRARKRRKKQILALALGAALIGGAGGFAGGSAWGIQQAVNAIQPVSETAVQETSGSEILSLAAVSEAPDGVLPQADASSGSLDVSGIAEAALPSVVAITNTSIQEVQRYFSRFGRSGPWTTELEETESCGSGVIIAEDSSALYIVTNQHVVDGASTLTVSFVDDSSYSAQICGTDESLDLAVIKVLLSDLSVSTRAAVSVAKIGSSDSLKVGNQVVAIGNAMGYGQSVTTGIVSALNRKVAADRDSSGNVITSTYIQTDAAINPGNSGGALLNMNGELIGINSAKVASTDIEGMGYAIPISQVWSVISSLMAQGGWSV